MDAERIEEYADEGAPFAVCPMCGEERREYEWLCDECQDERDEQGDDHEDHERD